jgi:hypothetical protein
MAPKQLSTIVDDAPPPVARVPPRTRAAQTAGARFQWAGIASRATEHCAWPTYREAYRKRTMTSKETLP